MSNVVAFNLPGQVDPFEPSNHEKPLWCVYGQGSIPSILACMINIVVYDGEVFGPNIWGYSVFRGIPGYRTLGMRVTTWMESNERYKDAKFFNSKAAAEAYFSTIHTVNF